jgi:choline dehydrogenase-like flavoprotein
MLNHPSSRGNIHIASPDIRDLPRYDGLGLNPLDTEIVARHVRFVETLINTQLFTQMLKPGRARVPNLKGDALENAREIVRQAETSVFHPSGSCRMLPREKGGVVDNKLRVFEIKGLRIVDASTFPFEPSENIQTVVYAVAEKAADITRSIEGSVGSSYYPWFSSRHISSIREWYLYLYPVSICLCANDYGGTLLSFWSPAS